MLKPELDFEDALLLLLKEKDSRSYQTMDYTMISFIEAFSKEIVIKLTKLDGVVDARQSSIPYDIIFFTFNNSPISLWIYDYQVLLWRYPLASSNPKKEWYFDIANPSFDPEKLIIKIINFISTDSELKSL